MARHDIGRRAVRSVIHGIGSRVAKMTPKGTGRSVATLAVAAVITMALGVAPIATPAHATSQSEAQKHHDDIMTIFEGTNSIRKGQGKSALKYDARITLISFDWSVLMGKSMVLAHNPNYSRQIPPKWTRAGENVAYACGYGEESAEVIVENWKNSPGHYRNLIGDFTSIGIGVYWVGNCMWATQNFAKYTNAPAYNLPTKSSGTSALISSKAINYSSRFTKEIASAKKASANAEKSRATASKALKTAKSARDKAKTYSKSKKASAKTKREYKKAVSEYKKASADYAVVKKRAATAKSAYSKVRSHAKTGKTSSVKSNLSSATKAASSAKTYQKRVTAHQKKISGYAKAAKKALRK